MCDCIKIAEEKIKGKHNYDSVSVDREMFSGQTYSEVSCRSTVNGKLKKKTINLFHKLCPWCGEPYDKEKRLD